MKYTDKLSNVGVPHLDRSTTLLTGTAFTVASAVQFGNGTFSAYGFNLSELLMSTAFSFSSISVSWASVISLMAIVGAYVGNNADITEFTDHQSYLGGITAFTVVLTALSSDVSSAVSGGTTGLLFTAFLLVGYISMVEIPALKGRYN